MACATHTTGTSARLPSTPIAAALAFEDASLRTRMRREARAAATLEMAVVGLDVDTLPAVALEDAIEAGEAELAAAPGEVRVAALTRALATLQAVLDDDDGLAVAA